jgi:2-polyprenyl-6-methoxyphenol hydroxylase-like FAD-dependent oxidoreductase
VSFERKHLPESLPDLPCRPLPTRYPFYYKISQNDFELALRELMLSKYSIGPEYQTELVALKQDAEVVTATIRHPDGTTAVTVYPWVVGCDGVHSFVRNAAGIKFEGDTVAVMSMADLELK